MSDGCFSKLIIRHRANEDFINTPFFQGRVDDNIETIRKRFKVFIESSLPVVQFYEKAGKVHKVKLPVGDVGFLFVYSSVLAV